MRPQRGPGYQLDQPIKIRARQGLVGEEGFEPPTNCV